MLVGAGGCNDLAGMTVKCNRGSDSQGAQRPAYKVVVPAFALARAPNCRQFAPDSSLDPGWFRSFETSTYEGANSIDLQEIDRPDNSYDFISLSMVLEFVVDDKRAFRELVRVGSDTCIIHNSSGSVVNAPTSTHYGEGHGAFGRFHYYGRDIEARFETARHSLSTLLVRSVDPVTGVPDDIHFFCRQRDDAELLSASLAQ